MFIINLNSLIQPRHVSERTLTLFVLEGGIFSSSLSYFNIPPKLNKSFALMHPDFQSNLITSFSESLVSAREPVKTSFLPLSEAPKKFHTVLSTMNAYQRFYSIHCTPYSLAMLIFSWNKIFYFLINVLHHDYVIDDVIIQSFCFFICFSKLTAFS